MKISLRLRRGAMVAVAAVAVAVAAAVPVTVEAGGRGATIVRGIQHEYGTCGGGTGYLMTGDIEGCWWIDTFDVKPLPVQGTLLARGREHFTGRIGSRYGTFYTTYTFTAKFEGDTELHGRCHHPVVGGDGDFAGISGVLNFTDVVDTDPVYYPYWGNLRFPGDKAAITISVGPATVNAAAPGVATAPC